MIEVNQKVTLILSIMQSGLGQLSLRLICGDGGLVGGCGDSSSKKKKISINVQDL